MKIREYYQSIPRELKLFAFSILTGSLATSIYDATFNNFLNGRFALSGLQRSLMEIPRELPGLLTVFVTALFWFLCSRRLGSLAMVLGAIGTLLIGFISPTYAVMMIWLFVYSLGNHLFLPIQSTIGMELASDGKAGQRLGQINSLRNFASIFGSFIVFLGFKYLHFTFSTTFVLVAVAFIISGIFLFAMKTQPTNQPKTFFKLHKEYRLFYALAILYGSRKQIFITFAPWVLVTVFKQPTQNMATLLLVGGGIGIVFQPILGWMVDHFGEKVVLCSEAVLLVLVCFGYGFSRFLFPESSALLITFVCFLLDQILMSVGMARSTYMKKIAKRPEDIQPALTASISIDHIFSISVAILGGIIWNTFGYQYVFLLGVGIATINFFVAMQIKLPENKGEEFVGEMIAK